jgi:hypothetical protein
MPKHKQRTVIISGLPATGQPIGLISPSSADMSVGPKKFDVACLDLHASINQHPKCQYEPIGNSIADKSLVVFLMVDGHLFLQFLYNSI